MEPRPAWGSRASRVPPPLLRHDARRKFKNETRVPDHLCKFEMLIFVLADASGCFWFTVLLVMVGSESSTTKGIDPG
jgi:hypothetical protein